MLIKKDYNLVTTMDYGLFNDFGKLRTNLIKRREEVVNFILHLNKIRHFKNVDKKLSLLR